MCPQQSAYGDASFAGCSKLFSSVGRNLSGSHEAIQNSLALWLCFYKIIIFFFFFFNHPWGVLPWKEMSPATGPTSELVLRWPLCQTECAMYRLALKFCMPLVHSDSAGTSGSSGLCRCLLWDNACGNLYFGLLISVAADAYRFDWRKLVKSPALPACSVVQYSLFLQLWGISLARSSPHPGNDGCFFFCFLIPAGRGITPCPPEELWTWCAELRIAHSLGTLTLGTVAWHFPENKASVWTVICLWGHPEVLHSQP